MMYPGRSCLPWDESVPQEVRSVLGTKISDLLVCINLGGSQNDIVLVDCYESTNTGTHIVKSILDHHVIRKGTSILRRGQ